ENEVDFDEKAASKFLTSESSELMLKLRNELSKIDTFSSANVKSAFQHVMEEEAVKLGKLAQPVRVAITGGTISPGIFETLSLLGKDRSLHRLDAALARVNQ
ncbi:MAG: glutamate--tRNA ligase, partial [Nitrospinae bacterium]|nr:glutamate--tRNA ligase [Nitrospinota bacterium]